VSERDVISVLTLVNTPSSVEKVNTDMVNVPDAVVDVKSSINPPFLFVIVLVLPV